VVYDKATLTGTACPTLDASTNAPANSSYDHCRAELWLVPAAGGTAIRLNNANGPVDAVANSWPTYGVSAGRYQWIAFSSRRDYGVLHTGTPPEPQIWIAALDGGKLLQGQDGSYAALWLPYQELTSGNHIARWGVKLRQSSGGGN